MKRITLKSPAKLNLFLKVKNKRLDGYHNLVTLFERIDLFDEIELIPNKTGLIRILCRHPHVPKGPSNLVYKAAKLLRDDFSLEGGVNIKIIKRIPVAAGLGGGSSNAATVLLGLNKLWNLSLSRPALVAYAKRLGSDVPFFMYDCSGAIGTQRGDKIRRLFLKRKSWHILIVPRLKVYTREIFGALNLQLTKKDGNVNILHRALRKNNLPQIGSLLLNDLETTIVQFHPNLLKIKEKLKKLKVKGVLFSGSGPSIFGLTETKKEAEGLKVILSKQYRQVFVVGTC